MIRSDHFLYDLREALGSPKLLLPLLVVAGFFTFFISLSKVVLAYLAQAKGRQYIELAAMSNCEIVDSKR
ncbi:MAG: hypothetical protein HYR94_00295 [Chloroflexi bacterium]|nr:hypothetical protein [Chloroflexota bacterium]